MILLFPTSIHLKSEQARRDFRPRSVSYEKWLDGIGVLINVRA